MTVTVLLPVLACEFAEMVRVDVLTVLEAVTGFTLNVPVVLEGSPETLKLTELLAPTA